ncbi:MAG: diguanylate cyclase [Candidatus Omnitrophica bacterium]|nr:diguanylate cyclase [Candidatus Omnitrophota bacterium]
MREKRKQKMSIFLRIMLRLTFPLLFLTLIFITIQLTNQMSMMNQFYTLESRLAFEFVDHTLGTTFKKEKGFEKANLIKGALEKSIPVTRNISIQIFDVFNRTVLFKDDAIPWEHADMQSVEKCLYEKQHGKPYYVRIDKVSKNMIAYIPYEDITQNSCWVARVIFPLTHFKDALEKSRWTLGFIIFFIILTGLSIGHGLAKSIVKPIEILNNGAREIMKGNLGNTVRIQTGDELETLASSFNHMTSFIKTMKESAQDSNPLTQLPGNQAIHYELQKRIHEKQKFVLFHADLNRFKVFNDCYGLAEGDKAIVKAAELLAKACKEHGSRDDFVGHQGGDDFVLIVKPNHAKEIAEYVTSRFKTEVVKPIYPKEDYERGYTEHYDRRTMVETGAAEARLVKFPLLSIALGGFSNVKKDFANVGDAMRCVVELKIEAKKVVDSNYLIRE